MKILTAQHRKRKVEIKIRYAYRLERIIKDVLEKTNLRVADERIIGNITFEIITDKPGMCIGSNGKRLRANPFIVRTIVRANAADEANTADFFIDVSGYKTKQIQKIQRVAYMMAGRAKTFEKHVTLASMNAYKRMIVQNV
jgi:predicted RNA-binding protein Jag